MTSNARSYRAEPRDVLTAQEISAIYRHFKGNKEDVCWLFSHNTRLLNPQLYDYEIRQYLLQHEGPVYKIKMMRAQMKDTGIEVTEEDTTDPRAFLSNKQISRATLDLVTINGIYNCFGSVSKAFNTLFGLMEEEVGRIVFYKAMNSQEIQKYKVDRIKKAFERYKEKAE